MPTSQRRERTPPIPAGPPRDVHQMPQLPLHPVPMGGQRRYHPGEAMNEPPWYPLPYGYGTPAFHNLYPLPEHPHRYPPHHMQHMLGPTGRPLVPMHAPQTLAQAVPNLVATHARPSHGDLDAQHCWRDPTTSLTVDAPLGMATASASTVAPQQSTRQFKNPEICKDGKY